MLKKLTIGFSTCPNDTFIFDAIVNKKIDLQGFDFDFVLRDVEELNKMAFEGKLDVTKLSYHVFPYIAENYQILNSGSALGFKNGPLVIAKEKPDLTNKNLKIAIPGKYTTANLLFSIAFPDLRHKIEMLFSDIEKAILDNACDAGVIIHENRFTFQEKGLLKLLDLGEFWENSTQLPIPLGGIVIKRQLPEKTKKEFNKILSQSVRHAQKYPEGTYEYVKKYAQEMDKEVMFKHINLYVNEFTENLGDLGKKAIYKLYTFAQEKNIIPKIKHAIFVE
ncbi:MAG: 1,4-dihydroxy-6-naphthoate synthase [Bacteroidia bacterium]|nr:MAG: 1,4-dihydroxy-6-naphthoate synthase [Bacteroidia bacterium]PIE86516.1 MAG: 1,4-dihydroxy-6-naphthoate synthase [Bacteroidia bacterium]